MASKRKPLEDARKRVKEKLNAIDEQKDFIENSVEQLTCGVKHAANSLLTESNKTKFFQKYRAVSQELEKCLDDLLLISDAISSLEDGDEEDSGGSEDDDKLPDDLSSPASHEENTLVQNSPKNNDLPECSVKSLQTNEKTSLISSSTDTTKDLIDFETQSPSSFEKERISNSSSSLNHSENGRTDKPSHVLKGSQGDILASSDNQNFSHAFKGSESDNVPRTDTINKQASSCFELIDISECKPTGLLFSKACEEGEMNNEHGGTKEQQANKQITLNSRRDSTSYVNDLFMSNSPLRLAEETEAVGGSSRRGSLADESEKTLELNCKNVSSEVGNETECGSPTAVRLQRIGFCEYKSQKSLENEGTVSDIVEIPVEKDKYKLTLDKSKKTEIIASENKEKVKTTANNNEQNKTTLTNIEKPRTTATESNEPTMNSHESGEVKIASHQSEKSKINVVKAPSQTTEKTQECVITAKQSKAEISGQGKLQKASRESVDLVQNLKAETSVDKAGDVIEEALTDKTTCKLAKEEGLQIPPFVLPKDNCLKVIVKEIVSPKDFWIQKATDDLDLLMEKMCYHFSKRAKSGDKGGLQDLPCIGHVCCGRYTVDNVWYRAVVTAVSYENNHVTVLYVDEGNSETLPLSRLRELDEKFATLPCQAMRVQLRGLKLSNDITLDKVNDWFKRRVSGETLEAVFDEIQTDMNPFPLDLYIRPHSRAASDVDYQKLEYNIHEMLIREGLAVRVSSPQRSGTSDDVSPPSSPSDQVAKSESIISSSVTSGFHDAPSPTLDVCSQSSPGCQDNSVVCRVPPPNIPVDSDGSVYMLVSHVVSPGEFYVHLISSESGMLDNLMNDMNQTYKDLYSQNSENFLPRVGDFCCAKFSADGNWYRGLILQVRCAGDSDEKGVTVEVFYIDFGNIEEVNGDDIRELLPQYMLMPAQVVRCSLADVNPSIEQECCGDVFDEDITKGQDDDSGRRSSRQRSRGHKIAAHTKGIVIAAGDEDSGDEFLNGDMDLLGQLPDIEKHDHRDRLRSSISDDIAKSHREPSLFSDTAVELFEKNWSGVQEISLLPSWSENATEYFKTLTLDARKLIGYIVPWDSTMLNNIVNYSQSGECSLPNLGPVLRLNLYDVGGEIDVFINAVMVRAKYASSNSIKDDIVVSDEVSFPVTENMSAEVNTSLEHVPVVRVSQNELSEFAENSQSETDSSSTNRPSTTPSTTTPSVDSSSPSSAVSPTTEELDDTWNPMACDFESYRNAYNVEPDNVDVAITGYVEDRNKICRFYRTKYGCYRGSRCPDQHIEQDISDNVLMDVSCDIKTKLPAIGSWILVKITTIYHPTRFWVHLPAGFENLTSQLIQSRSGNETSGEENLKEFNNMMKEMSEFYSKMFRRERSLIPPTEGELVVVRSKVDNRWYRGKVCEEKSNKVFFVDYGITESTSRSNICPIIPQFLHLPSQSFECGMFNIVPKTKLWTDDSRQHFKSLIEGKILVCQIVSTGLDKMFVNLFDNDQGESLNVAEQMVESGHAEYELKTQKPVEQKSL